MGFGGYGGGVTALTQVTSINQPPYACPVPMWGGLLLPPVPKNPPNRSPLPWGPSTTIPAPFPRQASHPRRQRMGDGGPRAGEARGGHAELASAGP